MLRIGKGNGQILLSCQSDRKQAKHLTLYKRLYKRRILYNQFTSNLQNKFWKSYWQTAGNEYNLYRWERNGVYRREGKAQRKRAAGRPEGHDDKTHFENCITFGKMWGIMRGEKHAESAKPQTEISIEHLHLLYKDFRIQRKQRRDAFRARNDENRKEGINNES